MTQTSRKTAVRKRLYDQLRKFNELHPNEIAFIEEMTAGQMETMRNWIVFANDAGYRAAKMRMPKPAYVLEEPWIICVICGKDDVSRQGLAVHEGRIVPDDYEGEWGGAPCCAECYSEWKRGTIKPWMTFREAHKAVMEATP
jgi:hypothetical protein